MATLPEAVSEQLDEWIAETPEDSPLGRIGWIRRKTGEVYVRFNAHLGRIDLANFQIAERHQRKGLARAVIEIAVAKPVRVIRVENILNPTWADRVRRYRFEGRVTETTMVVGGRAVQVDFIQIQEEA